MTTEVVVATAGHVSHGKSTLVHALTGTHPDRLPDERRRGMSISLGYASLPRPDGSSLALVDVPGHERLVRTMVSGLGAIDAALLVVAADDGPMPQTTEHLRILALLEVPSLILVMSRADRVDADWLALSTEAAVEVVTAAGLTPAATVAVSAVSGTGLGDLRAVVDGLQPQRRSTWDPRPWLPVDRAFSIRGAGPVVTGTLASGTIATGDRLWAVGSDAPVQVRSVQRWGETVAVATGPRRVALNLGGRGSGSVRPGMALADHRVAPVRHADVALRLDPAIRRTIRPGDRWDVLAGTTEALATVRILGHVEPDTTSTGAGGWAEGRTLAQLRFDAPIPLRPGDRFVLRRPSPPATVGGGLVLDVAPDRPGRGGAARLAELAALARGDGGPRLLARVSRTPRTFDDAVAGLPPGADMVLRAAVASGDVIPLHPATNGDGDRYVSARLYASWLDRAERRLREYHHAHPASPGMPGGALLTGTPSTNGVHDERKLLRHAVSTGDLRRRGDDVALPGFVPRLSPNLARALLSRAGGDGDAPIPSWLPLATPEERDLLVSRGFLVRCDERTTVSMRWFRRSIGTVLGEIEASGGVPLGAVRDRLGVGRDLAQVVMQYADRIGSTRREGDLRVAGPQAARWRRQPPSASRPLPPSPGGTGYHRPDNDAVARHDGARLTRVPGGSMTDRTARLDGDDARTALLSPRRHVVLSPHYDDMPLSLGASMAIASVSGDEVIDLVIFGSEPDADSLHEFAREHHVAWGLSAAEVIAARKAEEVAAVARIGASVETTTLPFHDAIYRGRWYMSGEQLFGRPHEAEAGLPARIAEEIVAREPGLLAGDGSTRLYAPLGVGYHVDHQTALAAAKLLADRGVEVWLYEDVPYSLVDGALTARLDDIGDRGPRVSAEAAVAADDGWREKIEGVMAYPSQLQTVFHDYIGVEAARGPIDEALSTWHRGGPDGDRIERFWVFAGG